MQLKNLLTVMGSHCQQCQVRHQENLYSAPDEKLLANMKHKDLFTALQQGKPGMQLVDCSSGS